MGHLATPLNPAHQLPSELAIEFGHKLFNFKIDDEIYFGIEASDGQIVSYIELDGYGEPDFEINILHADFCAGLECPVTLNYAYANGRIIISDNVTGLPEGTVYDGAMGLLFGITAYKAEGSCG